MTTLGHWGGLSEFANSGYGASCGVTTLGHWGGDLGISPFMAVASSIVMPWTIPVHLATGAYKTAGGKCEKYRKKMESAKTAKKRKHYRKLFEKWCEKASAKGHAKSMKGKDVPSPGVQATSADYEDDDEDDSDDDAGGLPAWAPIAIGVAALGLVAAVVVSQRGR